MSDHEHNWIDDFCTNCGKAYDEFKAEIEAAGAAIMDAVNAPSEPAPTDTTDAPAEPTE